MQARWRHQVVSNLGAGTLPFLAPKPVQTSSGRAKQGRSIHFTFPAIFAPFLPAKAEARDREGKCKSYVCISCQTYTPSVHAAAMAQAAGTGGRFWGLGLVVGSSLFVARSGRPDRSPPGSVGRHGRKAAATLTFHISCYLHPSLSSCWFRKRLSRPSGTPWSPRLPRPYSPVWGERCGASCRPANPRQNHPSRSREEGGFLPAKADPRTLSSD